MPTTSPASAKVNTTASAWSRLVQLTQTASKTLRTDAVKRPQRSESLPMKRQGPTSSERPAKIRRFTTQSVTNSSRQSSSLTSRQHSSLDPFHPDADCIEVCSCQEGDPCLPDGKCSLSRLNNSEPASPSPTPSTPKHAGLSSSWVARMKGQERVTRSTQKFVASSTYDGDAGTEVGEQDATTKMDAFSSRTPHELRDASDEETVEDQPVQQSTTGEGNPHVTQLDLGQGKQPAYTAGSPSRVTRGTRVSKPRRTLSGWRYKTAQDGKKMTIAAEAEESCTITTTGETTHTARHGLQESGQDALNRAPRLEPISRGSATDCEVTQLATPTSSQESTPAAQLSGAEDKEPALAPKSKRRLTLHGGSFETQHAAKKRKTPPKKKQAVQTTLSLAIGGSAGMRECKVCDTVYNPFHPEDIKLHAKRHAGVLKMRVASV